MRSSRPLEANKYIKSYGKVASDQGMSTCKLSDPGLLQTVELGIQFGKWVLLENIGENLDPALEPVLQQQKIKDAVDVVCPGFFVCWSLFPRFPARNPCVFFR